MNYFTTEPILEPILYSINKIEKSFFEIGDLQGFDVEPTRNKCCCLAVNELAVRSQTETVSVTMP